MGYRLTGTSRLHSKANPRRHEAPRLDRENGGTTRRTDVRNGKSGHGAHKD